MAGIDIISDSTGKEIVAAIQSTDVAQARILEINTAAEAKKNEVLESIPEDYRNIANEVDSLKYDIVNVENVIFIELSGEEVNGYDFYPPSTFYETSACAIKRYEIIEGETYYLDSKRAYALGNNKSIPSLYEEFIYAEDSTGYLFNHKKEYLQSIDKKDIKFLSNAPIKLHSIDIQETEDFSYGIVFVKKTINYGSSQ